MVFDLMYRSGRDLSRRPPRLEEPVAGADRILPVHRLAPNGLEAWARVPASGYEGLVAFQRGGTFALSGRTYGTRVHPCSAARRYWPACRRGLGGTGA